MHNEPSPGVGSIDYIHGLLIAEDDLDGDENESTNLALFSTSTLTAVANPEPGPPHAGTSMPAWCKFAVCKIMSQDFRNLSRSRCPLQLTIHKRRDIQNDQEDRSTRSFRKAGYMQYVLHCYGY